MSQNRLAGHLIYLIGPIDRVKDRGVKWRNDIKQFLWSLNIGVLDPCDKPFNFGIEDEENIKWRNAAKDRARIGYDYNRTDEGNYTCDLICEDMKKIVAADLRMIDLCHAAIMYIDTSIHMTGSYNEQTYACLEKKPVIICCKQGKMSIPDWLFGIIPHQLMFSTWDEVKEYVRHIAFDYNIDHLKRWRFLDMNKVYNREIFI